MSQPDTLNASDQTENERTRELCAFQFSPDESLRVFGTSDRPWFVAKEVAQILDLESSYRNTIQTLDADERITDFVETKGGRQRMVFISESAVYKMIFKSRKPCALRFQNWICREVLPSIRQKGTYQLQQRVDELEQQLRVQQRATQQLSTYVSNVRQRPSDGYIYIATTRDYATQNKFKVGGCASKAHLQKRKTTYNSGRAQGDELYYAALFPCHNHFHAQARIKEILLDFRERKEAEMYILPYEILHRFIEKIIQQYQTEIDELNQFVRHNLLESIVDSTTHAFSIPEPALELPQSDHIHMDVDTIDLETLSPEEQGAWVRKWVDQYQSECTPSTSILVRKNFVQFLQTRNHEPIQAKSRTVWSVLKQIAPSLPGVTLRYF
jgi:prophage antirepressor-like protein